VKIAFSGGLSGKLIATSKIKGKERREFLKMS
jgi:hypothetical protein